MAWWLEARFHECRWMVRWPLMNGKGSSPNHFEAAICPICDRSSATKSREDDFPGSMCGVWMCAFKNCFRITDTYELAGSQICMSWLDACLIGNSPKSQRYIRRPDPPSWLDPPVQGVPDPPSWLATRPRPPPGSRFAWETKKKRT